MWAKETQLKELMQKGGGIYNKHSKMSPWTDKKEGSQVLDTD